MRKSTKAVLAGAIAGLGFVGFAKAAPIVSVQLVLTQANEVNGPGDPSGDTNTGTPVPQDISGNYILTPGQRFFVSVGMSIQSGTQNMTGTQTARASATRNKPLGIGSLNINILSPSNAAVTPVSNGGTWSFGADPSNDLTSDGYAGFASNVNDQNSDGVPDVAGVFFGDLQSNTINTTSALGKVQYGDDTSLAGIQANHGYPALYQEGEYTYNGGQGSLSTQFLANNVYSDPGTNNNIQAIPNTAGNEQNATVTIGAPVPEPASLGLFGLLGLALGRRRRS